MILISKKIFPFNIISYDVHIKLILKGEVNMVSITILKNGEVIQECSNIQETGEWLKAYTGDKYHRFAKIENGYCYDEPWDFKSARYTFKADENHRNARREQLDKKRK
jgi:hypothetical protein